MNTRFLLAFLVFVAMGLAGPGFERESNASGDQPEDRMQTLQRLQELLKRLEELPDEELSQRLDRMRLQGLSGVGVSVLDLASEALEAGLTVRQLQTAVELRLRSAGIIVLTGQEVKAMPGKPKLRVEVRTVKIEDIGLLACQMSVVLCEEAILVRRPVFSPREEKQSEEAEKKLRTWQSNNPESTSESDLNVFIAMSRNQLLYAESWKKGYFGLLGSQVFSASVRDHVRDLVDDFANDFLAANPRRLQSIAPEIQDSSPAPDMESPQ